MIRRSQSLSLPLVNVPLKVSDQISSSFSPTLGGFSLAKIVDLVTSALFALFAWIFISPNFCRYS